MHCLNFACQLWRLPFVTVIKNEIVAARSVCVSVNSMDIMSMNQQLDCGNYKLARGKDLEMFYDQYCQIFVNLPWHNILASDPESVAVDESSGEIVIPSIVFNGGGKPQLGTFSTKKFIIPGNSGNYVFAMELQQNKV
jgi:hypothetical protein